MITIKLPLTTRLPLEIIFLNPPLWFYWLVSIALLLYLYWMIVI